MRNKTKNTRWQEVLAEIAQELKSISESPHQHKCPNPNCGHIWEHTCNPDWTKQEHTQAHTCSECGTPQIFKYDPEGTPHSEPPPYPSPFEHPHWGPLRAFGRFLTEPDQDDTDGEGDIGDWA